MTGLRVLLHRCASLWRQRRREEELARELEFHLQMETERLVQDGMCPAEARRTALRRFGSVTQTKESYRAAAGLPALETVLQDLRYTVRSLRKQPGFTAIAVLTLAVGIGSVTAIYTVVDATLLRSLPYREPDRLMRVSLVVPAATQRGTGLAGTDDMVWSYPKYELFRSLQRSFETTALYRSTEFSLTNTDQPERLLAEEVSASYFPMLGIRAEAGRTFLPEEDTVIGRDLVAVLSHSLWVSRYGADRAILGKRITLGPRDYTVVGVLAAGFQGLSGPADVWVPLHTDSPQQLNLPFLYAFQQVARRKVGISIGQAEAEVAALGPRIDHAFANPDPSMKGWGAAARTLDEARLDRPIRTSVLVLFGAVACVLLIACINLANLLLARGGARRREVAIRCAVGATRARLVRQLLTESLLLALLGAAGGLGLAYAGVFALHLINPANGHIFAMERMPGLTLLGLSSIRLDAGALPFTLGTALVTAALFGLAPAFDGARADVGEWLKNTGARPLGLGKLAGKNLLVIAEVALAIVLLVGAGLTIKSFARLIAMPTGVNPENVLTVKLAYPSRASTPFFDQLQERVAGLPGVLTVGLGDCYALAGRCSATSIKFPGRPAAPIGSVPIIGAHWVSPGYFAAMQIPLVRGRWFSASDSADSPRVTIINEAAARRFFPGQNPVGQYIGMGMGWDRAQVIGVAGDVRYGAVDEAAQPAFYVSYRQSPRAQLLLFVRTASNPVALVDAVRREIHALNKNLPLYDIKTMDERMRDATARARFGAILLAIFATIAFALAGLGIYGVMSYLVRQRTREIGIRMALGARAADVRAMVIRHAAGLVAAGVAIGVVGALAATRLLATMLYQVRPADPETYLVTCLLLSALALLAGYVPALRASRVDPCQTLRAE